MEKAQAELIWVDGKFVFELEIEKVLINYGTINEDGTPPKETFEAYFSRKTPLKNILMFLVGEATSQNNNHSIQKAVQRQAYCLFWNN